jgi:ribosomal 30S subunit maturation factor RimM
MKFVIDDLIDMSADDKQDSYVGNVASVHSFGAFDVVETNSKKQSK